MKLKVYLVFTILISEILTDLLILQLRAQALIFLQPVDTKLLEQV